MAVDSESGVDFRKGSDSWLVLGAMAQAVGGKTTRSGEVVTEGVALTRTQRPKAQSSPRRTLVVDLCGRAVG